MRDYQARAECELNHAEYRVPHRGFGWLGWRCTKCGYMFRDVWEDWVTDIGSSLEDKK